MKRTKILEYGGLDLIIERNFNSCNNFIRVFNDLDEVRVSPEKIEEYGKEMGNNIGHILVTKYVNKEVVKTLLHSLNKEYFNINVDTLIIEFEDDPNSYYYQVDIIESIYRLGYDIIVIDPNKEMVYDGLPKESIIDLSIREMVGPHIYESKQELIKPETQSAKEKERTVESVELGLGRIGRCKNEIKLDLSIGSNILLDKDKLGFDLDIKMLEQSLRKQSDKVDYMFNFCSKGEIDDIKVTEKILYNYLSRIDNKSDLGKNNKPYFLILSEVEYNLLKGINQSLLEQCLVLGERCNMGMVVIVEHSKEFPSRLEVLM